MLDVCCRVRACRPTTHVGDELHSHTLFYVPVVIQGTASFMLAKFSVYIFMLYDYTSCSCFHCCMDQLHTGASFPTVRLTYNCGMSNHFEVVRARGSPNCLCDYYQTVSTFA